MIVGGGDGTVMWVIEEMVAHDCDVVNTAIGIVPFGTGNDFARVLSNTANLLINILNSRSDKRERITYFFMLLAIIRLGRHSLEGIHRKELSRFEINGRQVVDSPYRQFRYLGSHRRFRSGNQIRFR